MASYFVRNDDYSKSKQYVAFKFSIYRYSMFCCRLLYVHFSIAIILMGKIELIALLNLPSWCLVMVERLFLTVPRGCLQFVIVVFPDHTYLLFIMYHFPALLRFSSMLWKTLMSFCTLLVLGTLTI